MNLIFNLNKPKYENNITYYTNAFKTKNKVKKANDFFFFSFLRSYLHFVSNSIFFSQEILTN